LRREGKLLSEAEKKRRQLNQMKLEQLKAQGIVVPALEEEDSSDKPKPKRIVYDNKKKKKNQQKKEVYVLF
jgi:translation initiation factor 5B